MNTHKRAIMNHPNNKGVQIYHMEKRGIESYVEKKRALSNSIQETKLPEIEQPLYSNYDIKFLLFSGTLTSVFFFKTHNWRLTYHAT